MFYKVRFQGKPNMHAHFEMCHTIEFCCVMITYCYKTTCVWCVGNVKSPLELSEEEWNHAFRTNLTGTWLVSKYVCKRMRDAQRKGSIINIASIAGLNRGQLPGGAAYSSSKAGVNMLTRVNYYYYFACDLS